MNIGTRGNKFMTFSYFLNCKIKPREFIERNIFYAGYEKSEINKENTKKLRSRNSSHRSQIPSFTTSKDFGYFILSKFPLAKTSLFKICETFLRSRIGYPLYKSVVGHTERSQQETGLQLDCLTAMERRFSD